MRATSLGHACWLIETTAGCYLTDPVLFDPFEEGTVVSCPRREVAVDRLPHLRGIFLSHRHLDHLDFPSLDVFQRHVPIYCPDDPLILHGLTRLGFRDIRTLAPFATLRIDDLTLTPLPSANPSVLEFGMLFRDADGALLDQVDAVLAPETIREVRRHCGRIDVHLAMYAAQDFGFFDGRRPRTADLHALNLSTALMLDARCVVPSAGGFRFDGDDEWLNPHVFPIDVDRFVRDLVAFRADLRVERLDPGDVIAIRHGSIAIERGTSDFVRMVAADHRRLRHDPSAPIPPLVDRNPRGYGPRGLAELTRGVVGEALPRFLEGIEPGVDVACDAYFDHDVDYTIDVVHPDRVESWSFAFRREPRGVTVVASDSGPAPTVLTRIAASALVDFVLGRGGYFAVRTRMRRWSRVVALSEGPAGVAGREVEVPDLLSHFVVEHLAGAERRGGDWIHFLTKDLVDE